MTGTTARFALPFILPGQAQKELFHNEALLLMDALVHAAVEAAPTGVAPTDPAPGQCWIVAAGATGQWAGQEHALALWGDGGWRFAAPAAGMLVWNKATGLWLQWSGTAWRSGEVPAAKIVIGGHQVVGSRQPEVPSPSGGTTIDVEARSAVNSLIVALRSHGLIE